jgi:DNA-binding winged helix-turn-helix (wHTH) protein
MKTIKNSNNSTLSTASGKFNYLSGSFIKNNGEEIFVEHRLKKLLYILLDNKNNFVKREELMDFVWEDVIVSNQSLTKAVSDLRKFINMNQMNDMQIKTVNKLGYKLIISEPVINSSNKKSISQLIFRSISYAVITLIVLIILVRAIRY